MDSYEAFVEKLISKIQKFMIVILTSMLVIVVALSTVHLGELVWEEIWAQPHFIIPVHGLLEIFGFFLLVLIGVELLETLKAYMRKDVIHVRVVIEVALIAMARKVIVQEPNEVPSMTLFGVAALILALAVAFYFERHGERISRISTNGDE